MRYGILFMGLFLVVAACLAQSSDKADLKVLQTAGLGDDGPKLVEYFRRRIVTDADRAKIDELVTRLGHDSFVEREKASAELMQWGLPAVSVLRQAMSHKDVEIARRAETCLKKIELVPGADLTIAAARAIAKKKPEGAAAALLTFLPHADDTTAADEICEALSALAVGGKPDPVLLAALDDPLPVRRGAAGEALMRANITDARRLMTDADGEVRMRIVLAAVTRVKDKTAVVNLINLLGELPRNQCWRAEEVLLRLAGDQAPAVSLGKDEATRKRCRDAWNEWWMRVAATTDLAKLDTIQPALGRTLIVQADQRSPTGQVYEIDMNGKVLWRINNLQHPSDAMIVDNDKVLIAEPNSEEVTLRDFRGNAAIRPRNFSMPCGFQALPNGRLLVVGRNLVQEWNDKRAKSWEYQRTGGAADICAACKLKTGDIWLVTQKGEAVRVDAQKKEKETKPLGMGRVTASFAGMDVLPDGHMLIAIGGAVTEFDANAGKLSWSVPFPGQLSSVQRLPNGNTLIAGLNDRRIVEIDRDKEVVWEYKPPDGTVPRKARRR